MPPQSCLSLACRGAVRAAAVSGLLALGACAGLVPRPAAAPAVDVPTAWSGSAAAPRLGATALAQWWSRFDDPLLAQLVSQALQANTDVTGAQAALRQARALRDVAAAALAPTLGGSASAQRGWSGGDSTGTRLNAGLDASWELDLFGGKLSALDAGEATARASAADLGSVRVSIAAEVALGYITLRSAQARLAIADDNLAIQFETLQITQWREQAGLVTSLESEQARASAEQTRAQRPALLTAIAQAGHALAVLTGQPPAALDLRLAEATPVPQAADDLALAIPAETLRQRADVRAAEHRVSAAWARLDQADAARLPSFRLSGSLGLSAATLGTLTNGASVVGSLLAGVSLPLFDGGALRAQSRAQQAALDQSRIAYHAAVLAALQDVENALVALRGDRERLLHLLGAAEAAANASQLARQRYSSGLTDFQTVLDTQRTRLSTQDGVATASADVSADHVRLFKALGGGWRDDDNRAAATAPASSTPTP
jgi:NodT family efflux transporter outer membrane factor (OMF) lipoprotein